MAFAPAFDSMMDPSRDGLVLSLILPAKRCNLSCPVCIIRQRKEAKESELKIEDYITFIKCIRENVTVSHIAIQGYEPLLPESWPFTKSILEYANTVGIESSLVTNGVYLSQYINELTAFSLRKISISLDAPTADWHDKKRGVTGAFDATCRSLEIASKSQKLMESLWVISVLYPGSVQILKGMPEFLRRKQVRRWAISPLIRISNDYEEGGVAFPHEELKSSISLLYKIASETGLKIRIDDEFSLFHKEMPIIPFCAYRSVERVDKIIRLSPSGHLSIGRDILRTVTETTPKWIPNQESPHEFIDRVVDHGLQYFERVA